MSKKKKLSPAELAKAKAAAALRAPLLILLTRKFGFARINPREAHVAGKLTVLAGIYRLEVDNRVYQVHIMQSGVYHAAYVSRPGTVEPGEAVTFKDKAGLLSALADCAMRDLPPLTVNTAGSFEQQAGRVERQPAPFDSSRPIDRQETQPVETQASKLFTEAAKPAAWPAAPAAAPIHWGDKPK